MWQLQFWSGQVRAPPHCRQTSPTRECSVQRVDSSLVVRQNDLGRKWPGDRAWPRTAPIVRLLPHHPAHRLFQAADAHSRVTTISQSQLVQPLLQNREMAHFANRHLLHQPHPKGFGCSVFLHFEDRNPPAGIHDVVAGCGASCRMTFCSHYNHKRISGYSIELIAGGQRSSESLH
jgi:hypothetical protein